jgi:hypothetical protein
MLKILGLKFLKTQLKILKFRTQKIGGDVELRQLRILAWYD